MQKIMRLITAMVDKDNPTDVKEYVDKNGFQSLQKAFTMDKEEIIQEVVAAKLLGRGGAAFPTGLKWRSLYKIANHPKYIVCNADEGEPGTFKDRLFIQKDPLSVIEGMTIAGYVFDSSVGYIYIRGEYRALHLTFQEAIDNAVKAGYLGDNILGTGHNFHIHIVSGAGAYVCGENSTLLNSIEGKAGRPRVKPPHLAKVGLYSQPTLVNNVETYANIPIILAIGAEEYRRIGSGDSGGTAIVCLSGHAKNRGYYEIPLGITIRDIIFDEEIGGGLKNDNKLKFYHLGGQSGPIGFPEQLDTPYTHLALREQGLSMGTGAVVVADENVCLIDYLRKVTEFFIEESCGKCNPCREGNVQILKLLNRFSSGIGSEEDIETMGNLSYAMHQASFCGLGQGAITALRSCIKHRRKEFISHLNGYCPVCFGNKRVGE